MPKRVLTGRVVSDKGDKTEKPTAKRLKEARKEGRTPRTPELGSWLTMLTKRLYTRWISSTPPCPTG